MSATVAGAIGNPDPFKQPSQQVAPGQGDQDKRQPDGQMLRKSRLDPEPWKHDDLGGNGQNVANDDIRHSLD
jgi:hypothetical protein